MSVCFLSPCDKNRASSPPSPLTQFPPYLCPSLTAVMYFVQYIGKYQSTVAMSYGCPAQLSCILQKATQSSLYVDI